jgi:hypothetical protein
VLYQVIDVVERTLYTPCRFLTLKVQVKTSSKTKFNGGGRRDVSAVSSFRSQKFPDRAENVKLVLDPEEFLVFSYGRGEKGARVFEEVFMSYPHLPRFRDALTKVLDQCWATDPPTFFTHTDGEIYLNENVDLEGFVIDELAQSKQLMIRPEMVSNRETEVPGVGLYINGMDKRVELTREALGSLEDFVSRFDLLQTANTQQVLAAHCDRDLEVPESVAPVPAAPPANTTRRGATGASR